jgi:hypothetical protein
VGRDLPRFYEPLHLTVFPAVFLLLALVLWVGWVQWAVGREVFKPDAKL